MLKKITMALTIICCSISAPSNAMTWSELDEQIHAVESGKAADPTFLLRLSEMIQMFVVMTEAQAEKDASSLLFCPPKGGQLNLDQVTSMIRKQARDEEVVAETLVQYLLLQAFISEFPC